jgi:hypothetical protein
MLSASQNLVVRVLTSQSSDTFISNQLLGTHEQEVDRALNNDTAIKMMKCLFLMPLSFYPMVVSFTQPLWIAAYQRRRIKLESAVEIAPRGLYGGKPSSYPLGIRQGSNRLQINTLFTSNLS